MFADTYSVPLTSDPVSDADGIARLFGMGQAFEANEYTAQAFRANQAGVLLQDLSPNLAFSTDSTVQYDSTAAVPAGLDQLYMNSGLDLVWGADIVALFQLIRNRQYNAAYGYPAGTWHRYPIGHYIVTTPGFADLDVAGARSISGLNKNYLLQSDPPDALSWDAGTKYKDLVEDIFQAAGLVVTALREACDYPGGTGSTDWPQKTLLAPINWTPDQGTYLDLLNEQLTASGCRPVYVKPTGRWQIDLIPKPAVQPLRWRWAGSANAGQDGLLPNRVVLEHSTQYENDLWNVPNQWVFNQDGLTFDPVEGSGRYTVNNTSLPPSDQVTLGRIIRSVQLVQASGQADLVTQGDAIVQQQLSQAEKIEIQTRSWPMAGHYDVFSFYHQNLPESAHRRVQAAQWNLSVWGEPTQWTTYAVASL